MGVFNKTPYTNFHELNLNWIIKKIKEVAADNAFFKQFFKTIEDEHILGVVTKVTENNNNTVKTDYLNEDTQQMDNYTVYNKTGTDGAISGAVSPIANRVTTAEGDIDALQTGKADANLIQGINLTSGDTILGTIQSLPANCRATIYQNNLTIADAPDTHKYYMYVVDKQASNLIYIRALAVGGGIGYSEFYAYSKGSGTITWRTVARNDTSCEVVQIQLTLPSTVTVPAGGTANLLSAVDPATLTKSATIHGDTIPDGRTLYGAVFLWTNSSVCSMTNCLVEANNKLTVTVYNHSANPVSASGIRLLLFYK